MRSGRRLRWQKDFVWTRQWNKVTETLLSWKSISEVRALNGAWGQCSGFWTTNSILYQRNSLSRCLRENTGASPRLKLLKLRANSKYVYWPFAVILSRLWWGGRCSVPPIEWISQRADEDGREWLWEARWRLQLLPRADEADETCQKRTDTARCRRDPTHDWFLIRR